MNRPDPSSGSADASANNRPAASQTPAENHARQPDAPGVVTGISLGFFVLVSIFWGVRAGFETPPSPVATVALLCLAGVTLVASYSRTLPFQNVMLSSAGIGVVGMVIAAIAVVLKTDIGLFPNVYPRDALTFILTLLMTALLWIVFLLAARSVARWSLRAWRDGKNYGLWLLALTAVLASCLVTTSRPILCSAFCFSANGNAALDSFPQLLTWLPMLGWFGTAIAALLAGTSSLFDKRIPRRPGTLAEAADRASMAVWFILNLLCTIFAAGRRWWEYALIFPATLALLAGVKTAGRKRAVATVSM